MGNSIFKRLFADKNVRILIMGRVSQTSILHSLKLGKMSFTIPLEGVFVEKLNYKNVEMLSLDLGSRMSIRPLLPHYFTTIQGLVFTVDCSGYCYRVENTVKEFCEKTDEANLPIDVPVLVVAYYHDSPQAKTLDELTEILAKENCFKDRRWNVRGVNIDDNDKEEHELFEAFEWLTDEMLVNEKEKMALSILAGGDTKKTTNLSDKIHKDKEDKDFLSKFVESLKKTLVCRPTLRR